MKSIIVGLMIVSVILLANANKVCEYNGNTYNVGDNFMDAEGCNRCFCAENGAVGCTMKYCPPNYL
ncbi:hypothetical protein DPMN_158674 [Dreissena polymorpha]|uniref:Pacifastin domain-containing protein n=1 Tax=Dreissena polymorpha TaxID=45954 RepID=A0A9D4ELT3_DREPO|nr:hypothetical protein DPMN_158674 [Dreissena polymorpha]